MLVMTFFKVNGKIRNLKLRIYTDVISDLYMHLCVTINNF